MIKLSPSEKKHIIIQETLHKKRNKKLCIVSHYDPKNMIQGYVSYMLKELHKAGFDIVVVSTSQFIPRIQRVKIDKYLRTFILKKNSGYDFVSWKVGMAMCEEFSSYNELLLINDSIFFPLTRPKKIFDFMRRKKYDFWGLLDSYNRKYHVQSFFWFFNKKIKNSIFFSSFWSQCEVLHDKTKIINQYETRFTSLAQESGFCVGSYIQTQQVREYVAASGMYVPKDEILFYALWPVIIARFHAPLLKRNMLCPYHQDFNPLTKIWREVVGSHTDYNLKLIAHYLSECGEINSKNKQNWILFFVEFITQMLALKDENVKVLLYGYSYVGKLVHSILSDNVVALFDRNYEHLNSSGSVEVFSVNQIKDFVYDKVFICSFGREDEIVTLLKKYNITRDKVITMQDYMDVDSMAFSNFLTKLLKLFHGISYLRAVELELQFYQTDSSVVKAINGYLKSLHILPLKVYPGVESIGNDTISLIDSKTLEVYDMGVLL